VPIAPVARTITVTVRVISIARRDQQIAHQVHVLGHVAGMPSDAHSGVCSRSALHHGDALFDLAKDVSNSSISAVRVAELRSSRFRIIGTKSRMLCIHGRAWRGFPAAALSSAGAKSIRRGAGSTSLGMGVASLRQEILETMRSYNPNRNFPAV